MCTGDEDTLLDCLKVDNIGTHDCSHSEDAGVRCEGIAILLENMEDRIHQVLYFSLLRRWKCETSGWR